MIGDADGKRNGLVLFNHVVTDDSFLDAVAAWELDKAVYEVNYALNNRPDWLQLPLVPLGVATVPDSSPP